MFIIKDKRGKMNRKAAVDPLNLIIGLVAILGAVLIIFNQQNYGIILLVIATLIESISRVLR